jgi:hypothetical protein
MDLMDLKPKSDTVEVILRHPSTDDILANQDGSEMTITLHAQHSAIYKQAMHEQQDRRIEKLQKKKNQKFSAADLERDVIDLLCKCTAVWDITFGGEQPKLSLVKAKEVYTELWWIRDQLSEAWEESTDFTTA